VAQFRNLLSRPEQEEAMIARIWQGCTRPGMGNAYMSYLEQTGLKEYQDNSGLIGRTDAVLAYDLTALHLCGLRM